MKDLRKYPINPNLPVCAAALLLACLHPAGLHAQGYTLSGNRILVDRKTHWEGWDVAGGIAEVSPEGSVRPRFMRKHTNVALDAEKYSITSQGGVLVVSNQRDAPLLIDGDAGTSWSPDKDSPLDDWRIELSLGRLVVASRISLRFAEEGDPFLQFKVLAWRHGPPRQWDDFPYTLAGTSKPKFWEVGRTIKPNKTRKLLEFVPPTTQDPDDFFVGDPIEFVQVIVTDSDFDRGREIPREEYDVLPDDSKGAVEYYTRSASGRETLISQAEYQGLDPRFKGPVRYYRREIPRLAELEVWTPGDNVNLGAIARGGRATIETNAGLKDVGAVVSDGLYSTGTNSSIFPERHYAFFEDLGARFWLDTLHLLLDGPSPVHQLYVDVSDGTLAPDGSIEWIEVAESIVTTNFGDRLSGLPATPGSRYRQIEIDPVQVRFLRTRFRNPLVALSFIGFTEVMLYGEGYVSAVTLVSDLIELGGNKNLLSLDWEADTPPGTRIELRTRTGNELEEERIYRDSNGNVVSESKYGRLPKSKKGEITSSFNPSPDWVPWSVPYSFSGEEIKSPSPREFMLIRARLLSDRPDAAATLKSITVNISVPLADELLAEVWPTRVETTGRLVNPLSLYLRPGFGSAVQGFDEIMIESSPGSAMELLEVRLGTEEDFGSGRSERLSPSRLQVFDTGVDTLWFRLPDRIARGVDLVEVVFRPTVFSNSVSFKTSVQDSGNRGFWQRVDEGDATNLVDSEVVTVLALEGNAVIEDLHLDAVVITPNDDRVNDSATFSFTVSRVKADEPVTLTIYDLGGIAVARVVEQRPDPRGSYELVWTGRDQSGSLVPPGIYLALLEIDVDSGSARGTSLQRVIHVAY